MPWAPTAEQLLDFDGVRRRADRFRFELWHDDQIAGTLTPDAARPPTVSVDTGRAAVRSLSDFYLPAGQLVDIDTGTDRARVVMQLQDGTEYSLGWFMWADDSRPVRGWGVEHDSTLVDEGFRLDQDIGRTIGYPKGTNAVNIAVALARAVIPRERIAAQPDPAGLGVGVAYAPGDNRFQAVEKMLARVGYLPPYFDRDNQLVMREAPDPDLPASPGELLTYGPGPRVVADSITESDDNLTAPNRYVVYESSGQGPSIVGAYDIPASAPHSVTNRAGTVVVHSEAQQGLTSTAQAHRAARALYLTSKDNYRYLSWQSPADPRHEVWDQVEVFGARWLETSWSIVCRSGGLMTHEARRLW